MLAAGCGTPARPAATGAADPASAFAAAVTHLLAAQVGDRPALAARVLDLARGAGTPVMDGDTLTFVYAGSARQVQAIGSFVPALDLHRVEGTDLWLARKQVPDLEHATLSYLLSVDDQIIKDPLTRWTPEATQPKQVTWHGSRVSLPPELEPASNVPHGALQEFSLESTALGDARKVTVYLPPGFNPQQRYPVLYATDAQIVIGRMRLPAILDNLIAEKKISPVVAVCIDSNYEQRQAEYLPDGERWDEYQRFFLDELMPQVERQYPAATRRDERLLLGLSNGAAWSAYTAAQHPDLFRGAISLSVGLTSPEPMPAGNAQFHQQYYVVRGTLEEGFAEAQRYLVQSLHDMGMEVKAVERPAGHEPAYWSEELVPALLWLLPGSA